MPVYYLDHHATTPCDPRVVEAMLPYFSDIFGNPAAISTPHGRAAARAVDDARGSLARLLGVDRSEIIFTSGATEANHLAFASLGDGGGHVITTALEHKSVLDPLHSMRALDVEVIEPDAGGVIDVARVAAALRDDTRLVSVTAASGEIGTIQPIEEIAAECRKRGVPFHTDATQAVGKLRPNAPLYGADMMSLSAHKFYGPKGIGALVARRGVRLAPWTRGGGQERGLRSGTVNVPGVVGLARALEIRDREQEGEAARLRKIQSDSLRRLSTRIDGVRLLGSREQRLPGNLCVSIDGVDADSLIIAMKNFSFSAGSACSTRDPSPSRALLSLGLTPTECMEAFRIGMGASTTQEIMDRFIDELDVMVSSLRHHSPHR